MLSIQVLKSSGGNAYNYYFRQEDLPFSVQTLGQWFGKGAEILALDEAVDEDTFKALYEGILPNGQRLGRRTREGIVHRPGVDLTFSSPKSFSIALALTGDKRLVEARNKALSVALCAIEKDCAMARRSVGGELKYEKTDNLLFALAPHLTSRALDPQDHVHCLLLNITRCSDGAFRALSSQKGKIDDSSYGVFEQIMARKKHYGLLFRVQLAAELTRLGFELNQGEQGFFEIKGISQKLIDNFSKRRLEQILPALAEVPYHGGKAAAIATLNTRQAKPDLSWPELLCRWHDEVKALECEHEIERVAGVLAGQLKAPLPHSSSAANEAMAFALLALEAKFSVFTEHQLLNTALGHLPTGCSVAALMAARDNLLSKGKLIALCKPKHFTSAGIVAAEQHVLQRLELPKTLKTSLLSANKAFSQVLNQSPTLTSEQKQGLQTLSQSTVKWQCLKGGAGTGKRTLSALVAKIAHKQGYQVTVLAPSSAKAKEYRYPVGIKCQSFLQYQQQLAKLDSTQTSQGSLMPLSLTQQKSKQLLIIHEAEKMGSLLLSDITALTENSGARGLLVFNPYTTQGLSAGSPLQLLKENALPAVTLTEPYHAFSATQRKALSALEKNQLSLALTELDCEIHVAAEHQERLKQMVANFCKHFCEGETPLVLASYQEQALALNQAIRAELKKNDWIDSEGLTTRVLIPKALSRLQTQSVRYYQKGQWLSFDRALYQQGININTYAKIIKLDHHANEIMAQTPKGKILRFNPTTLPPFATTVHTEQTREFVIGDKVRALKAPRYTKLPLDKILTISHIKGTTLTLAHGRFKIKVNVDKALYSHLEHGYAQSAHKLPLHTQLLAHLPSTLGKADKRQLYRLITDAKALTLYTDNREKLLDLLARSTGDNVNLKTLEQACLKAPSKKPPALSEQAIDYAITHLIEREAGFHVDELFEHASYFGFGHLDAVSFERTLRKLIGNRLLQGMNRHRFQLTTDSMHSLEQLIVVTALHAPSVAALAKIEGSGEIDKLDTTLNQCAKAHQLVPEQQLAFENILTSSAPIRALQGFPGTGKSTLLKALSHYCQEHHVDIIALAPTINAANNLKDDASNLNAQTLDSFLVELSNKQQPMGRNTLIILDEASMVSNQKLFALQSVVLKHHCHLLYAGDERQLMAIDAGKPFVMLQLAGLPTDYFSEMKRQQTQVLKKAVHEVALEKYQEAFKTLGETIVEIESQQQRLEYLADTYAKIPSDEREQWLVITPKNDDRRAVNALIREQLQQQGELSGQTLVGSQLIPKNLTRAQISFIGNYHKGDVLRFNGSIRDIGVRADHFAKVIEVCHDTGQLRLQLMHEDKEIILKPRDFNHPERIGPAASKEIQPLNNNAPTRNNHAHAVGSRAGASKAHRTKTPTSETFKGPLVEVYQHQPLELNVGDKLRTTRTDKKYGLITGGTSTITAINQQTRCANLLLSSNKHIVLALDNPKSWHVTHAYTSTTHTAQGSSVPHVLYLCESNQRFLTHQRSFWVGLSRAIHSITLVTDCQSKLLKQIERHQGQKLSAMEVLQTAKHTTSIRQKQQQHLQKQQESMNHEHQHQQNLQAQKLAMKQARELLRAPKELERQ